MASALRSDRRTPLALLAALPLAGLSVAAAHALSANLGLGSLLTHMLQHIALINIAAAGVAWIWRARPAPQSGAALFFASFLIFVFNMVLSLRRGALAGENPWDAGTHGNPPEGESVAEPRVRKRNASEGNKGPAAHASHEISI